jgi:hypothetical protein
MDNMPSTDRDTCLHPVPEIREAHDAQNHNVFKNDPSDQDAGADIASDESFPASDPPSHTMPGAGEPAPSSGYDPEAEKKLADEQSERSGSDDNGVAELGSDPWIEGP